MLRITRHRIGKREIRRVVSAHPPCAHERQKLPLHAGKRQLPGIQTAFWHNHNVQTLGDVALAQPEKLPHETLYPVAPYRVTAFSRYRKPKTPLAGSRWIKGREKNKIS